MVIEPYHHFPIQGPPKFTKIGILGTKNKPSGNPAPATCLANYTIASYNASVVNFYDATGSLARFENKNIIFYF
jgi:hypothetical protein